MTEYLTKMQDGSYKLIPAKMSDDDIAVPEGAEALTHCVECRELFQLWWKGEYKICVGYDDDWFNIQRDIEDYLNDTKEAVIVWQRSLNDKVASAEVARQELKGVDATLADRQSTYGSFEDVSSVTQDLLSILKRTGYESLPKPHKEALHMICSKMARIVNGDSNHLDSWHDIGGYAKLIEDLIREAS